MATPDSAAWQDAMTARDEVSTGARLVEALDRLTGAASEVAAAAVVSLDGLTMASALPHDVDEDHVGAMSAALLSLGEQAASGLGRGQLRELVVDTDAGLVLCLRAGDHAVLLAVTAEGAKLGLVRHELRLTASEVATALDAADDAPAAFSKTPPAGRTLSLTDDVAPSVAADAGPEAPPTVVPGPPANGESHAPPPAPGVSPVAHPQADASDAVGDDGDDADDPGDHDEPAVADRFEEFVAIADEAETRWRERSRGFAHDDADAVDSRPPWAVRRAEEG